MRRSPSWWRPRIESCETHRTAPAIRTAASPGPAPAALGAARGARNTARRRALPGARPARMVATRSAGGDRRGSPPERRQRHADAAPERSLAWLPRRAARQADGRDRRCARDALLFARMWRTGRWADRAHGQGASARQGLALSERARTPRDARLVLRAGG